MSVLPALAQALEEPSVVQLYALAGILAHLPGAKIIQQSDLLNAQRRALDDAQCTALHINQRYSQRDPAIDQLKAMTLAKFWQLDPTEQNQLLHRLMGDWRIEAQDGDVIGLIDTRQDVE